MKHIKNRIAELEADSSGLASELEKLDIDILSLQAARTHLTSAELELEKVREKYRPNRHAYNITNIINCAVSRFDQYEAELEANKKELCELEKSLAEKRANNAITRLIKGIFNAANLRNSR